VLKSQKLTKLPAAVAIIIFAATCAFSQPVRDAVERGSVTAKNGFRNETEIAEKFNAWRTDDEAKQWLNFMGYKLAEIESVSATKPHGEKADIEVRVRSNGIEKTEGISIKLVSTATGFNQVDKRWVDAYARLWKMPTDVADALRFFVGEKTPNRPSRNAERMFLNELDAPSSTRVVEFFTSNKAAIVADIFRGDGDHAARWMLVALKVSETPRWVLRSMDHVIKFYSEGSVVITKAGNLKLGRVAMQRKGGDGGRNSARMLQFKINPALLFDK
jgi:hypothetical protein